MWYLETGRRHVLYHCIQAKKKMHCKIIIWEYVKLQQTMEGFYKKKYEDE